MPEVRHVTHRRTVRRTSLSGIPGYHACCRCGWQGPYRHDRRSAREDFELHDAARAAHRRTARDRAPG